MPTIIETADMKILQSEGYNYIFNKETGEFVRWGETQDHDPQWSPHGPEIADIEISTVCSGVGDQGPCKFCYKSNTAKGDVMSLETFERLLAKFPRSLTQIAFGIGDIDANPDMWEIFEHCRGNGVIPNVTINGDGLTDEHVERLSTLCGAVAVSRYAPNEGVCYDAVKRLTDAGISQVNIHMLVSEETFGECMKLVEDYKTDPRLKRLNAVVFLALKPKGRGKRMRPLKDLSKYEELFIAATEAGMGFGFDSCSAPTFLASMKGIIERSFNRKVADKAAQLLIKMHGFGSGGDDDHHVDIAAMSRAYSIMEQMAEPCESMLFSIYVDVHGKTYPCSFLEGLHEPIDVLNCEDFMRDVWNSEIAKKWRESLLATAESDSCLVKGCRQCPAFDIY